MGKGQRIALLSGSIAFLLLLAVGIHHNSRVDKEVSLSDSVVVKRSYFDRVGNAFLGCFVGLIIFITCFVFIFVVEKVAVIRWLVLSRAKKACVQNVSSVSINRNLNCRLVHISGDMQAQKSACDNEVGYTPERTAVVLKRTVEVRQWQEYKSTEKDTTTYTYSKVWSEADIDSSSFQNSESHRNVPRPIPVLKSKTFFADANLGAYRLNEEVLEMLKRFHTADPAEKDLAGLTQTITSVPAGFKFVGIRNGMRNTRVEGQVKAQGEEYWTSLTDKTEMLSRKFLYVQHGASSETMDSYGATEADGTIGDMRVSYDVVLEGQLSVVGVLQEDTFRAFTEHDAHTVNGKLAEPLVSSSMAEEPAGGCFEPCLAPAMGGRVSTSVLLVEERAAQADSLFRDEGSKFSSRLLILRAVSLFLLALSIYMMLSPVAELVSFLPFVDSLLKGLFFLVALLLGLVLWALATSIAWAVRRPEFLAGLLLVCSAALYLWGCHAAGVSLGTLSPLGGDAQAGDPSAGMVFFGRYFTDMALGEWLGIFSLLPLGLVAYNLVEELRFSANIHRLNQQAGVA